MTSPHLSAEKSPQNWREATPVPNISMGVTSIQFGGDFSSETWGGVTPVQTGVTSLVTQWSAQQQHLYWIHEARLCSFTSRTRTERKLVKVVQELQEVCIVCVQAKCVEKKPLTQAFLSLWSAGGLVRVFVSLLVKSENKHYRLHAGDDGLLKHYFSYHKISR